MGNIISISNFLILSQTLLAMEATLKEDDGKSAKVIVKGFEVRNDFFLLNFLHLV